MLYSHRLEEMLGFLPEVKAKFSTLRSKAGQSAWTRFLAICEEWTVYARYSPRMATLDQATIYINTIKEVKKWLRDL